MASPPPIGRVRLVSVKPSLVVECALGDGRIKITDGFGGWEVVEIPKELGLTEWQGGTPFGLQVPVIFDRFRASQSVEPELTALYRMGRDPQGNDPPPIIQCFLPGNKPLPPSINWVVSNLDHQDDTEVNGAGHRTRQSVVVELLEFNLDERLAKLSPAKKAKKKAKKKKKPESGAPGSDAQRIYIVKGGETLSSIAQKFKIKGGWKTLGKLNKIRDPKSVKKGQEIKLP